MKKIASIVLMGMILGLGVENVSAQRQEENTWTQNGDAWKQNGGAQFYKQGKGARFYKQGGGAQFDKRSTQLTDFDNRICDETDHAKYENTHGFRK